VKFLWVTDPWETLDHPLDTSLRLVEESLRLGHPCWWCDPAGLRHEGGRARATAQAVRAAPPGRGRDGWTFGPTEDLPLCAFDQVHYRVDPPVDRRYLEHLQLLAAGCGPGGPELVNPWQALLGMGDKLGPPALARALPPTIVSSAWDRLAAFGRSEGRTVLKPLGGAQSQGVRLLEWTSPSTIEAARAAVHAASEGLRRPVLLQRFLPEVRAGEVRVWLVDGQPLAHVRKRPLAGDFVVNMDQGSCCEPCVLGPAEAKVAAEAGKALAAEGVRLAAIDVIAGHVTDWNVTSPGARAAHGAGAGEEPRPLHPPGARGARAGGGAGGVEFRRALRTPRGVAVPRAAARVRLGADAEKECSAPTGVRRPRAPRRVAGFRVGELVGHFTLRVVADFGQRLRGRSNPDARVTDQVRGAPAPTVGADSDPAVRWAAC
jgi:glutathione synthase